jgi:hypothetical protein
LTQVAIITFCSRRYGRDAGETMARQQHGTLS